MYILESDAPMTAELTHITDDGASVALVVTGGGVSVADAYLHRFTNATTRRTMAGALDVVASVMHTSRDAIQWHAINGATLDVIRSAIIGTHAPATVNKCMVAMRGCLRLVWLAGIVSHDTYARSLEATKAVKRRASRGRIVAPDEYAAITHQCTDDTPAGVRDVAILHMMRGGGLRRHEVAHATIDTYEASRGALHVVGKGGKPRVVYLPPAARLALDAWLALRGTAAGALFVRINKAGTISRDGMTPQAIYDVVRRRVDLVAPAIRPHDLRRTYATHEAMRGVPLPVLQRQLGHASLATTSVYMMHNEDEQARHAAGLAW